MGCRHLPSTARSPISFSAGLQITALLLLAWSLLTALTQSGENSVATMFFNRDILWLFAFAVLLAALSRLPGRAMRTPLPGWSRWSAAALVVAVVVFASVGSRLIFHSHAFTQDETMAQFDAAIFRHGDWVARIPELWRPYADALVPRFTAPVAGHAAWISCYLPGNAAIRALLDNVFGLDLASPVLAGIAILAVGGVARRMWPERPDAALVAAILLATSPQFLVTAATPFAMTAHLAFDLVWLWLFLRGGVLGHAGAVAVTFVACGLHQLVFHPLFACPFVAQLWLSRRWALAGLYTLAFAASALFWIFYWQLVLGHEGLRGTGITDDGIAPFAKEVVELVRAFSWSGLDLMAKNVTRFLAWQNVLALPLALFGVANLRRIDSPLAALAAGFVVTLLAMCVLLPYQGFGWGYRYLHGLLGSLCLLAAAGWIVVTDGSVMAETRSRAWAALCAASVFTAAVVVPTRAVEVARFVAPYAEAEKAIRVAPTDLVFVDTNGTAYTTALVRNDPYLRNKPLILDLSKLTASQVDSLCAVRSAALFDARDGKAFDLLRTERVPEPASVAALQRSGCAARHVTPTVETEPR